MLEKLLKYDLNKLFKSMSPIYMIVALMAVFTRIFYYIQKSIELFTIPFGFIVTLFVLAILFLPFITLIISSIRFFKNVIKDEGYLTNTLPVKKSDIILSKLLSYIVVSVANVAFILLSILISSYATFYNFSDIDKVLDALFKFIDIKFIILMILTTLFGIIMSQTMIFTSITFGQRHNKNKGVMSFIYLIGFYYLVEIVMTVSMYVLANTNEYLHKYINVDLPPVDVFNIVLSSGLIFTILFSIIFYVLTEYNLDKKLNLE